MEKTVHIIGAGLAGSEAALQLASRGIRVRLFEMRPSKNTVVHKTPYFAELVCSNSLKSKKPESAAGMLKAELGQLGSFVLKAAYENEVDAGGALAVDRDEFAASITAQIEANPLIELVIGEVTQPDFTGADAVILATGPLTSDALADWISQQTGAENMAFFDAAAPIVMADSLNMDVLFRQSRYEENAIGDYLNAPFNKENYDAFIDELLAADKVIKKEFETKDLFQACQPIEEIARKGHDAPRFGTCKPVGLTDPATGRRPWAAVQLRAENAECSAYNLVGFQTNLTFGEQKRVFRMIPGLEQAEFARYGVMHRNTFICAPKLLDGNQQLKTGNFPAPVFVAGQLSGTEGYCEAIASGLLASLHAFALLEDKEMPTYPDCASFGALMAYATNPDTEDYQPMHVNFGIMPPLPARVKNKQQRYAAYAQRGAEAMDEFIGQLKDAGIL